jgi:hypothetical protein
MNIRALLDMLMNFLNIGSGYRTMATAAVLVGWGIFEYSQGDPSKGGERVLEGLAFFFLRKAKS